MVRKTISGRPGGRGAVRGRRGGSSDGSRDACPVSNSSTPLDAIQERVASEVPPLNPSSADGRVFSRVTPSASEVLHMNLPTPHDVAQESSIMAFEVPHLSSSTARDRGCNNSVHPAFEVPLDVTEDGVVTTSEMSNLNISRDCGRGRGSVTFAATVQQSNLSTILDAIEEKIGITSEVPDSNPSSSRGMGCSLFSRLTSEVPHLSSCRDHSRLIHSVSEVSHLDSSTSLDATVERVVAPSGVPHSGPSIPFNAKYERDIDGSFQVPPSNSCMSPDVNQERVIDATVVQQIGSRTPLNASLKRDVDATSIDTNTSISEADLLKIHPDGDGFAPNPTGVAHYIGKIIQTNFNGPWPTWNKVPMDVRDMWFEEFKKRFCWLPEHERQIRINFENKGRIKLKECFCDARKKPNVRPFWLSPEVWDTLLVYWGSDEFKAKSAQAKKNRASGDGLGSHTGGSIPASEHKRRLEAKLGREITTAELFMHLHQKKDKSWVDKKSSQAYEKFARKWKDRQASQNSSEGPRTYAPISELDVWINENGKRGRIHGLGSEGTRYKATSQRVQTTTSSSDSSELRDMLSKMQEELKTERQEKEELARRIAILERDKVEKDEAISRMQRQTDEVIAFMMKQHRRAVKQMNKKFEAMMYMFRTSRCDYGDDTSSDSD